MTLYELQAHDTRSYNLKSNRTVRLKDDRLAPHRRVDKWVADYLREFPHGVVVLYEIERRRKMGKKRRYVRTYTNEVTV